MQGQLPQWLNRLGVRAAVLTRAAWSRLAPLLRAGWRLARPVLRRALEFLLALIIVFEEWGWQPLAALLGRLARWRPWAAVESVIIRLPPYVALVVFLLPTTLLLPLKLIALVLIANGRIFLAGLLFVAAKLVATALIARLYMLTQPALMQIGWFAWTHDTVMPWKDALVERVHASWPWRAGRVLQERAKRLVSAQARRLRPTLLELSALAQVATGRLRARAGQLLRDLKARWAAHRSIF